MASSITSYKAYGLYIDEPITTRAHQVLNLVISQLAADVTLDLGNTGGTFWGSADDTAVGLAAKLVMDQLIAKAESRISWCSPQIQDAYTQLAAAPSAATDYQITTTSIVPTIVFKAASAPTDIVLNLVVCLAAQQRAIRAGSL